MNKDVIIEILNSLDKTLIKFAFLKKEELLNNFIQNEILQLFLLLYFLVGDI